MNSRVRKPSRSQIAFLLGFHAVISGAFLVSYLTGDGDDVYFMHVFAGYAVLAALAVRLAVGMLAGPGNMLRLPRPDWAAIGRYLKRIAAIDRAAFLGRSPLHGLMAVLLLVGVGIAAASGAIADFWVWVEDLHEVLGELALYVVIGHIALVLALHGLKRLSAPAPIEPKSPIMPMMNRAGGLK
jgi:cytochrome b